jgi:hypothetical protein
MDQMTENKVKACLPCQIVTPIYTRELLQMSVLPDNPFDEVSVDFASVNGETLPLLVDDYSRFPFVEPVSSTSASAVIPKLDKLFATFGTPLVVRTDNGPPFSGDKFVKFSHVLGFKHRKVTPLWPRANGEVERFVKTLKKYIKAAKTEGTNNLRSNTPNEIAKEIEKICNIVEHDSPSTNIAISQLIVCQDSAELEQKRICVNETLSSLTKSRGWKLIIHNNIHTNCLNGRKVHLNNRGTINLAKNFKIYLDNLD